MSSAQPLPLGFFQFDNLVRNKVPFLLLTSKVDLEPFFGPLEKLHLRNYSIALEDLSLSEVQQVLMQKQIPLHHPIVLLCEDGKRSQNLAQALAAQSYLNVYFVSGGFLAFKSESTLA